MVGAGLVFPIITLTALLLYSLKVGSALSTDELAHDKQTGEGAERLRIHVVGKQWWWEVRYEQAGQPSGQEIVLANELRLPINRPIDLVLSASDVIHSFWVPSLA